MRAERRLESVRPLQKRAAGQEFGHGGAGNELVTAVVGGDYRAVQGSGVQRRRPVVGDHGIGRDQDRGPLLERRRQDHAGIERGIEKLREVEGTEAAVLVGVQDQRHLVCVMRQVGGEFGRQRRPPPEQGLRPPGGGQHDQLPRTGAQHAAVAFTEGTRGEYPFQRGVADDRGAGRGPRAERGQAVDLAGVGKRVQRHQGFAAVPEEIPRVETGGRTARPFPLQRLAEAGTVRQEDARPAQQPQIALGAGGDDQVVPPSAGLVPGERPGAGPFHGGQCVDAEVRAGNEREVPRDALVTGEHGQHVEEPVQCRRRPRGKQHRPAVARRPSPVARRPSPVARRPSPVARRPTHHYIG